MTASIQSLLVDTARKERLEGEIAIARTIQQKLLPPPQGEAPGLRLIAEFEPVAEIGGDYYDYFPMPDGRTAVVVGDVSGPWLADRPPRRHGQGGPFDPDGDRPDGHAPLCAPQRPDPPVHGLAQLHDARAPGLRRPLRGKER